MDSESTSTWDGSTDSLTMALPSSWNSEAALGSPSWSCSLYTGPSRSGGTRSMQSSCRWVCVQRNAEVGGEGRGLCPVPQRACLGLGEDPWGSPEAVPCRLAVCSD